MTCTPSRTLAALAFGMAVLTGMASQAQVPTPTIVGVEEDWELVVGTPDVNSVAPQVTCMISPTGNMTSLTGVFELNHRSLPSFVGGGLQLQAWDGDFAVETKSSPCDCTIATSGDTIRWTKKMSLIGGNLVFEIENGSSTTWGAFGPSLKTATSTTLVDLNGYSPDFSVENSGVGYAANRVVTLVLKEVRLVPETGDVLVDSTLRTVHSSVAE